MRAQHGLGVCGVLSMASESVPAAARREKVSGVMVAIDRNTATHSLLAAKQLYGSTASTTRARSDVFCAGRTAVKKKLPPDTPTAHSRGQHQESNGQLRAVNRRKRPRCDPKSQGDLFDGELGASTLSRGQVASKAAPRLTTLEVVDNQVINGVRESPVRSGDAGGPQVQRTEKMNDCDTPEAGVPACSPTPKRGGYTTSVGTTDGATKPGRSSRRRGRGRTSKNAAGPTTVQPGDTATKAAIQVLGKLNGVKMLRQRQLKKETPLLTPGEQEGINRVLKKLAAQIDGKRIRTWKLFALVRNIMYGLRRTRQLSQFKIRCRMLHGLVTR